MGEGLAMRLKQKLQKEGALLKARAAARLGLKTPHLFIFRHLDDEPWLLLNTAGYRRYPVLREFLPSLPPEEIQRRFVGLAGDSALTEAHQAYLILKDAARRFGRPLGPDSRVLDFGAGWGRVLRFFMRDVKPENLLGVDVMDKAVELARQNNRWLRFEQIDALPPIDLPSSSFDLIYLFSVFSHLSEKAHDLWVTEFARILKPGGLLVATTREREFIEQCERARRGIGSPHPEMLGAFRNPDDWLARYDRGEFCHEPVGGGVELSSSFYGETCIPEAYVRTRWTDRFEVCEFMTRTNFQNVIVARKPKNAK